MKTLMTLAFVAIIGLVGTTIHTHAMDKEHMMKGEKPTIIMFHADTCGKCKILGPKVKGAVNSLDKNSVNIVKFDYTNRATINSSKELAAEKGLVNLQKKYGAKTGFAVIVDSHGHEVHTISANDSIEAIRSAIQKNLS